MTATFLKLLDDQGWTITRTADIDELINLSECLGQPLPSRAGASIIDELRPISKREAQPRSLSALHGLNGFPLHTDTAHWRTPARYIALRAATNQSGARPTAFLNLQSLKFQPEEVAALKRATFSVRNGRHSFLCTMISADNSMLRFDPGCMTPTSNVAASALAMFSAKVNVSHRHRIFWRQGDTLILDNWRLLHGRASVAFNDSSLRLLQRILVRQR
jgi:alpha-ketoglutarate-dependent taurine dioxygenase